MGIYLCRSDDRARVLDPRSCARNQHGEMRVVRVYICSSIEEYEHRE